MSRPELRHRRFIHKRNRRLFFESLEKREVLTTIFFIMGNPQVVEPSVPGTTVNAQFSISYTTMGGPDVGGSVNWGAGDPVDTATSGADYVASSGTVNLGPGNTSQIINVPVKHDQLTEGNEHFRVTLSGNSPGSMIMQSYATGVISDPPPPPPGVSVSSSTRVTEGQFGAFIFTKSGDDPLTVYYELDPSTSVSSADYEIDPAFGSVYFAAGEHSKEVSIEGVEDGILEHLEELTINITPYPYGSQGPVPYIVVGQGGASLEFHDGNAGILAQDFDVEWLDTDGAWAGLGDGDTLWADETLRWIPDLPQEIIDDITNITWLKRAQGSTTESWAAFATGDVDSPAIGNPGPGYWDVTFKAMYGIMSFFQAVEIKKFDAKIDEITWGEWNEEQQFYYTDEDWGTHYGPRVFPEDAAFNGSPVGPVMNKVKVFVTLMQPVPADWAGEVKVALKAFDPDHAHHPTEYFDSLDPNDWVEPIVQEEAKHTPNDNRKTVPGGPASLGGTLTDTSLTFAPTERTKETSFTINDAQPDNNFKLVTTAARHGIDTVHFLADDVTDGVTLYRKWEGHPDSAIPFHYTTDILTVWRTLWIERDSMGTPDPMLDGPFNAEDPNMGNVPDAPITLLHDAFYLASIDVKVITNYVTKDTRDDAFFIHNIENFDTATTKVIDEMRDVPGGYTAWVVELVGAYEGPKALDFDDEDAHLLGFSVFNTNVAYVFLETIRDRAAYVPPPQGGVPASVNEELLKQRLTLHEVGHVMGLPHSTNGGVMESELMITSNQGANSYFTWGDLGKIQAQPKPNVNQSGE